jgi:uncharacterized membrane protein
MKATIGIYENHDQAVEAVQQMKDSGYPVQNLSIIGKSETEDVDENMNLTPKAEINPIGLGAGTAIGATVGILTGVGIFAIPGLGFLFGAGALVGAIAGFDFGLIGGGIASVLSSIGVKDEPAKKYAQYLEEGKYLIIAQGTEDETAHAKEILHKHGTHAGLEIH